MLDMVAQNSPVKRGTPEIVGRVDGVWVRFKDGPWIFGEGAKDDFVEGGEPNSSKLSSLRMRQHYHCISHQESVLRYARSAPFLGCQANFISTLFQEEDC